MAEHALSKKTERIAVTVRRNGQDPIATHREVKKVRSVLQHSFGNFKLDIGKIQCPFRFNQSKRLRG